MLSEFYVWRMYKWSILVKEPKSRRKFSPVGDCQSWKTRRWKNVSKIPKRGNKPSIWVFETWNQCFILSTSWILKPQPWYKSMGVQLKKFYWNWALFETFNLLKCTTTISKNMIRFTKIFYNKIFKSYLPVLDWDQLWQKFVTFVNSSNFE